MRKRTKMGRRVQRAAAVRQSVTLPAPLAVEVRRVAKERHLTVSRALVSLVARGVEAEMGDRDSLEATYDRFMNEKNPVKKENAGQGLIRAVFGHGQIRLKDQIQLPDKTKVYVIVPESQETRSGRITSPRLVHPQQASDFVLEVVEDGPDAGV